MPDDVIIAELRTALETERARLRDEIAEYERSGAENISDSTGENNYRDHMGDQGSATFAREMDISLEDSSREQLGQVERALERIEEGRYGQCTRCADPIPLDRLRVVPAAELCISCKEWEESR